MLGNHKSARRSGARGQQASPLGRGFLTGLLTGAVLTGGVFVAERFGLLSFDPPVQGRPSPAADTSSSAKEQADKPRFEFYTLLPEMEVVVETEAFEPRAGKRSESVEPPPLAGAHVLQAGSFRSYGEADALKASLALVLVACGELPEARELDRIAAFQRRPHFLEKRLHQLLRLAPIEAQLLMELLHHTGLRQRHINPSPPPRDRAPQGENSASLQPSVHLGQVRLVENAHRLLEPQALQHAVVTGVGEIPFGAEQVALRVQHIDRGARPRLETGLHRPQCRLGRRHSLPERFDPRDARAHPPERIARLALRDAPQALQIIVRLPIPVPGLPRDLGGGIALDARKREGALGALRLELAFPLAGGRVLSSQRAARSSSRRDSSYM